MGVDGSVRIPVVAVSDGFGQIGHGSAGALDADRGSGPVTGMKAMVFQGGRSNQDDRKGQDKPLPPQ